MPIQRSAEYEGVTRRTLLQTAGAAGATGIAAAIGGCVGSVGSAAGTNGGRDGPVSVLAAGSLQLALSEGFRASVDREIRVEAHGSVTAARLVAEGKRDPDILALADPVLFDSVLATDWHVDFATPDLDPLGYRTLFSLALASDHYDRPGLRDDLTDPRQVYPETSLLSRFETGDLDAAVVYRSMAVDRGYDYVDLPAAVDLGDPARTAEYRTASYELPTGRTVRGAPVTYAAVARYGGERVADVYERLVAGEYLGDHGFARPDALPEYSGDVPRDYRV
ncbi:ABC transporter substrate-binding protein [Halobacteriales archaeon QS_9_67_15]|nr:MAG: ABC transporter substrate-binding protein [Halobacteriales archaeon QS_9_67_15]